MKKIIILAAALLIGVNASAQLGITGGITTAAPDFKTAFNDLTTGDFNQYHVGIVYKLGIGNLLAIQPGIVYNVKGATIDKITSLEDVNYKTGYLEIPVQVQAGLGIGSLIRAYALAEPFIGYAVTDIEKAGQPIEKTWEGFKERAELGLSLGAGVEILRHVQVSAKYFWNFGNIKNSDIKIEDIKQQVLANSAQGVAISATILF